MKHLLLTTIAAVVLLGCGKSSSELLTQSVREGNVEAVKQHLAADTDVNAKGIVGETPLHQPLAFGSASWYVSLEPRHAACTRDV